MDPLVPPPAASSKPIDRATVPVVDPTTYGTGVYRRRYIIRAVDENSVVGEIEDDFHHFRVQIEHDGTTITGIHGTSIRHPWDTCRMASTALQDAVGTPLAIRSSALGKRVKASQNCTHMFDLAGLVAAHAARAANRERRYDMAVSDLQPDETREATLWVDGAHHTTWWLKGNDVTAPDQWVGAPLWQGFIAWADANHDPEMAEAVIALRRALDISRGRLADLDELNSSNELRDSMLGICFAFQPERIELGRRQLRSARDFANNPEALLSDFNVQH